MYPIHIIKYKNNNFYNYMTNVIIYYSVLVKFSCFSLINSNKYK